MAWRFSEFIWRVTSSKMSLMRDRFSLASSRRASARRLRVLNFGDAGGLFDDGAAVGRLAAEDLADASLLDDGVGLGPEAGAHEDVLNVAQAAELAVEQIFAFAGAEQAARDCDFSGLEGALELAAADLEHDLRAERALPPSLRLRSAG